MLTRFFIIFLLLFFYSCKQGNLLINNPQNVKKVYNKRNKDSMNYLITLIGSENRDLSSASIIALQQILIDFDKKKNIYYKKNIFKDKHIYIAKITKNLIDLYQKDIDFNKKHLIIEALHYTTENEIKNNFFMNVIQNNEPQYTKTILSFPNINIKQEELKKLLKNSTNEKFLYLFNYYTNKYPLTEEDKMDFLTTIDNNVTNEYIKNICILKLQQNV